MAIKRQKKTVVVGIEYDQSYPSNLDALEPIFQSRIDPNLTIRIELAPRVTSGVNGIRTNVDMLISGRKSTKDGLFSAVVPVVPIHRVSKTQQALMVNMIAERLKLIHFRKLVPYFDHGYYKGLPQAIDTIVPHDIPDVVICRPNMGAEGGAQIKVDTRQVSWEELNQALQAGPEPAKRREDLAKKYPGLIFTGTAWKPSSELHFPPSLSSYCITEYVDNVQDEFRILLHPQEPYVYPRRRSANDAYPQCDNTVHGVESAKYLRDFPDAFPVDEVSQMLKAIGNYGSVDLFTTTDGKWGIFEYSEQFGVYGNNRREMLEYHEDLVSYWVDTYLEV